MPVQSNVRNLDLTIQTDKNGQHVIVFPNRYESLVAPESSADKMEWIRSSYDSFIEHVRERNVFRRHAPYN
ncbi:MAG TPA: hypothetical protein V6C76_00970 [Drouetiella sp.]